MTTPSERQAEADDNARAEEAYLFKRDELAFWEAAFCAALTGMWAANPSCLPASAEEIARAMAASAAGSADAALSARRQRMNGDDQ